MISGNTSVSLSTSIADVTAVSENVTEATSEVAADQFVETSLTAEASDSFISFNDPLEITGHLETVDGEPIASQDVAFSIGGQLIQTETDEEGDFELSYRPTTLGLATEEVTLTYRSTEQKLK